MNHKFKFSISKFIIAILASGIILSCDKTDNSYKSPTWNSLDSIFCTVFPERKAPGAVIMVVKGDSVIYNRSFGMATLDRHPQKMTDSTLLNICSLSKQFSAAAILKLEELGQLSLDDKLDKYFPYQSVVFDSVAMSHLLSHTSGLPDNRPYTKEEWKEYAKKHNSCFSNIDDFCHFSTWEECCKFYDTLDTLKFKPGTSYDYQNPTYQLILPIVESITGKYFDVWMKENIFKPAGMTETFYFQSGRTIPRMAHAYKAAVPGRYTNAFVSDDGRWEEYDYGEAYYFPTKADGGIYTSARDFIRWQRALFSGKILSDEALAKATSAHIATDVPYTGYGYGFFIEEIPGQARKIYHTGDNGGFYTYAASVPEKDVNYIIFANRNDWDRDATVAAVDSVLRYHGVL